MSSAICFNLDQSEILSSDNGLIMDTKNPFCQTTDQIMMQNGDFTCRKFNSFAHNPDF